MHGLRVHPIPCVRYIIGCAPGLPVRSVTLRPLTGLNLRAAVLQQLQELQGACTQLSADYQKPSDQPTGELTLTYAKMLIITLAPLHIFICIAED